MNLDKTDVSPTSLLTLIPLRSTPTIAPYITDQMLDVIREQKANNKKTYIFYNRRGSSRAWICQDCGHFEKCPHCDIAYAVHLDPRKELVCHQCGHRAPFPIECTHCGGVEMVGVGIGLQHIEKDLLRLLGSDIRIRRIDSDTRIKDREIYQDRDAFDVFLMTQRGISLHTETLGAVIFPCFEINLSLPDYQMEEKLFLEVQYFKKQQIPIYIQTYTPEHELLSQIVFGNQKQFLDLLSRERKMFCYPPFSDFITLKIHHTKKDQLQRLMSQLIQKIAHIKHESTFFAFDQDIYERYAGEWVQKIILKDTDLTYILGDLERDVVRNRSVTLEWN